MNIDLLSAIIGGLIAGFGAIAQGVVSFWLEGKREQRQRRRDWETAVNEWETTNQNKSLRRADLAGADLRGINLSFGKDASKRVDLSFANLRKADLSSANLIGADLRNACLRDCNLTDTNLTNALLINADLRGAKMSRVVLHGANLYNANLKGAIISKEQLQTADTYVKATLPDGTVV